MRGIATVVILSAPLLVSRPPPAIDVLHPLAPPLTPGHLLGTDQYGRDTLARILYGGRIDLALPFGATHRTPGFRTPVGPIARLFGRLPGNPPIRVIGIFFPVPLP